MNIIINALHKKIMINIYHKIEKKKYIEKYVEKVEICTYFIIIEMNKYCLLISSAIFFHFSYLLIFHSFLDI